MIYLSIAMGCLEEVREDSIKAILNYIQGLARGYTGRMEYKKLIYKRNMIPIMQRNMKKYLFFRDWTWYFLVNGTKRFIGQVAVVLLCINKKNLSTSLSC